MHLIYCLDRGQKVLCGFVTDNVIGLGQRLSLIATSPDPKSHYQQCRQLPTITFSPALSQNAKVDQIDSSANQVNVTIPANATASVTLVGELGAGFCLTNTWPDVAMVRLTLRGKLCFHADEVAQLLSKSDRNDLPGGKVELILSEGKLQLVALVPHVYALFLADSAKVKLACKRDNIAFDCPIGNGQSAKNTCAREKSDSIKTTKVKVTYKSPALSKQRKASSAKHKYTKVVKGKVKKKAKPTYRVENNVHRAKSSFKSMRTRSRESVRSRQSISSLSSLKRTSRSRVSVMKKLTQGKEAKKAPIEKSSSEKSGSGHEICLTLHDNDPQPGLLLSDVVTDLLATAACQAMAEVNTNVSEMRSASDTHQYVLYYKVQSINRPVGVFTGRIGWTPEKPLPVGARINDGRLDIRTKQASNEKIFDSLPRNASLIGIRTVGSASVVRIYGEKGSGYAFNGGGYLKLKGRLVVTHNLAEWKQSAEAKNRKQSTGSDKCQVEVLWGRLALYICDQDTILLVANQGACNYRLVADQ